MPRSETNSPGLAKLGDIFLETGDSRVAGFPQGEWDRLVFESGKILRIVSRKLGDDAAGSTAFSLANVIRASGRLGEFAAERKLVIARNEKARAGKKRKADQRWVYLRCAIVSVCQKQKLQLVASDAFAESIRPDVIEAAVRFGMGNNRAGTSTRTIERHIAALLEDRRLLNRILRECDLKGWL